MYRSMISTPRLDFSAGPQIGRAVRRGWCATTGPTISTSDLAAAPGGPLIPPAGRALLRGRDAADRWGAQVRDDTAFRLDDLSLRTQVARLTIGGRESQLISDLDVRVTGRALARPVTASAVPVDVAVDTLAPDLQVAGPLTAPALDVRSEAAGVETPRAALERLDLDIAINPQTARPTGDDGADRFDFRGQRMMRKVSRWPDSALDRALGGQPRNRSPWRARHRRRLPIWPKRD